MNVKNPTVWYLRSQVPNLMQITNRVDSHTLSMQERVAALVDAQNLVEQLEKSVYDAATTLGKRIMQEVRGFDLDLDEILHFNVNYVVVAEQYENENNIQFPTSLLYAEEAEVTAYIEREKEKERQQRLQQQRQQKDAEISDLKNLLERLQKEREKLG